ncbi:btaf1 RNA polymerase II, B-TFIID transcription factor-associated, 170kDa [Ancistrocladus abbreviatus]
MRYQQEGINWLVFLRRFKLHGILCDDMGLGKTLQASAIIASDIAEYRLENSSEEQPPSLIICPSTLVGRWAYEIEKYIDPSLISTLQYVGSAQERISLRSCFDKYNVIITSYDVVHKDIDYLGQLNWNYCILDEGHIIKNARSKITSVVKQLKTHHRLILSGTPIQGISAMIFNVDETTNKAIVYAGVPNTSQVDSSANAFIWEYESFWSRLHLLGFVVEGATIIVTIIVVAVGVLIEREAEVGDLAETIGLLSGA